MTGATFSVIMLSVVNPNAVVLKVVEPTEEQTTIGAEKLSKIISFKKLILNQKLY
jgi:hypothetical protein